MTRLDEFAEGFLNEPGYLDYGRVGPLSATVVAEIHGNAELASRARFGSLEALRHEDERFRGAVSALTGFPADQVVFQPNTSTGLMHTMFGLTGAVLLSPGEFPAVTFAAARAAEALHVAEPTWLETDHGRVTPERIREQITAATAAVAVSLVDSRTGYLADLEGIRRVIGDRLLIVDAIQGFGVVDAPYDAADVVLAGGQKWVRAGWGTGFMALSARALDTLTPVMSGFTGAETTEPFDRIVPPARAARAFTISNPDRAAQARFAAALEEIHAVGIATVQAAVADRAEVVISMADEFSLAVISPREQAERAGIVVVEPPAERLTLLTASLFNHGITATTRGSRVRISVHAGTDSETLEMLRAALTSYASAVSVNA